MIRRSLCIAAVWLATVAVAEHPPPEFRAETYDSFTVSMTGPARGCEGWHYRTVDCSQQPGGRRSCHTKTHATWMCDVHPWRLRFDLDGDLADEHPYAGDAHHSGPPGGLDLLLDGQKPFGWQRFWHTLVMAGNKLGWPVFLRTDFFSGKHSWEDTCFVPSPADIGPHVSRLVEESALVSIMGCPTDMWVLRKLLPTAAAFYAFHGRMPVTKERRYFIRDGEVICHHPYWPADVIRQPSCDNWKVCLDVLNKEPEDEIAILSALSNEVAQVLPGYWSVDWLWVPDHASWYLIDMAEGESSWHWPTCENCTAEPEGD